ncbi:2-dehydro-3-deoxyphosphooctonate aldolase kdsA [Candidatus Kinetoplastibacterium blastocrithidii TCC012E]|uniref:2-dehydro-3-deoxyphosphooctonate aldolase n=1 Tax=Candidatus Kinetoplastidibacterium blastocrithidiae TCC012E TaxID=1208922 RepID=M1M0R7_9PROT|nr:3-deoxy-8-phosphooctulonate synthase [Candidatus Kinetoplastibacterium blastocrithidii]AFZ83748.1 2-dehydro-3-deoxyphosphooctonate aldolase [Candidatus Kinetoplastibacterium blastocrithidii (ex Strigomonas culicis)]AGF49871.1 2-dehydro-3-deoxyphosphooctonate aldolase kdsA [Candidatus Kinetoplastibacterium blastocrithidii TCC012E]
MKLLDFDIGIDCPLFLIAGPCVIESSEIAFETAKVLKDITDNMNINFIYKSSFDKANRSSDSSFRGIGIEKGLQILCDIRDKYGIPVTTDVHDINQINVVSSVVDVLQTPAFLCRQTDFIKACAATLKPVNIKKGQFLSPHDMTHVVNKARSAVQEVGGNTDGIMVCERGSSFGYGNLVVDMRSLSIMRDTNCPVIFDATHSVQLPGSKGSSSGGDVNFVPVLARAAVAVGISGLFIETHPNPSEAKSDGSNSVALDSVESFLKSLVDIDNIVKGNRYI